MEANRSVVFTPIPRADKFSDDIGLAIKKKFVITDDIETADFHIFAVSSVDERTQSALRVLLGSRGVEVHYLVVAASRKIQKQLRDLGFSSVIIPGDLSQELGRLSLTSLTANLESAEESPKEHPAGDIEEY